jgi:hypothetical protein
MMNGQNEINHHADADGMEEVPDYRCVEGCPVAILDKQSGDLTSGMMAAGTQREAYRGGLGATVRNDTHGDTGGASRFFPNFDAEPGFLYCAKPARAEKEVGLEGLTRKTGGEATSRKDGSAGLDNPRAGAGRNGGARNTHPTVKSVALMRWLCRLITPPGGLVLDCFMGSGTTGVACSQEGFRFLGIEREAEYLDIARRRICGDAPLLNRSVTLKLDPPEAA